MFGWMRRRSKSSETDNDDGEQLLDSLERQLAAVNQERDAQANTSSILKAFAEVLAKSSGRILDARQLPFPKNVVREAFDRRIRFLERCSVEDPGNPALEEDLGLHRSLLLRVSDFQEIDPEDEMVVIEAPNSSLGTI